MSCIPEIIVIVVSLVGLWILHRASSAACDTRDILKRMMKEFDNNNDLPKV